VTEVPSNAVCTRFHHAVELIGRRWSGAVLRTIMDGERRFAGIRSAVPGLSDTMLAQRLRELEAEGLLDRRVVPTTPVRVEYHLTQKGAALEEVMCAIGAWADEWVPATPAAAAASAS
jgi:DNA-binding HxlR family transcriptional regulator